MINGSGIIGEIYNDTEVFIVGRSCKNYFTYTDRGFVSFGSNYRGEYRLFTVDFSASGLKLRSKNVRGLFPRHCDAHVKASCEECVSVCDNKFTVGAPGVSDAFFKLSQKNSNVPLTKLYAGIWYNLMYGNNNADVLFDLYKVESSKSGFAGEMGDKTTAMLEITFIPFSNNMSFYHQGTCMTKYKQTAFRFFEGWVKGKHPSIGCTGSLGSKSEYCIFTGTSCLDGTSFRYCEKDETCGNCFGPCENGGVCTADGSGFYCQVDFSRGPERKSKTEETLIILGIVGLICAVLMITYALRRVYLKRSTA